MKKKLFTSKSNLKTQIKSISRKIKRGSNHKKSSKVKKKVARSFSKKIQDSMHLDQMILDLAAGPYKQILKQIEKSKIKLDQESRVALLLGSRILEKARLVRDQLVQQAQKVPGVAYVAQKTARDKSVKRLKSKRQTTLRKTTRKVAPKKSLKSV